MSQDGLKQAILELTTFGYISVAVDALLFYEYIVTFEDEVRTVWHRPWSAPSMLLLSVRWNMLLTSMTVYLPMNNLLQCSFVFYFTSFLNLIGYLQSASLSALRVYVLSANKLALAAAVMLLGSVPFTTNLFATIDNNVTYTSDTLPLPGCDSDIKYSERLEKQRTFGQWRDARKANFSNVSVTTCLLRDGACYFLIFLVINLMQMILPNEGTVDTYAGYFISNLPPLLLNRFIINLRSVKTTLGTDTINSSGPSLDSDNLHIAFLGNVGESLINEGHENHWYSDD
ncbi:hypothetical protein PHLGIDRAFT_116395 [Phlebiopsis gigantea 11061_1 CR5-6]|uniref:DUF6533 domain-containing protein n=1 Tax=Phlebiopsis gigantea (strain 11061_1 CR5-6) TaxID=745531 RepID=A0A0C3SAR3_PHLG1|nr:hypothetical protein PHLGIDRAFT_116395 [Phlebiopsis gigantea 11061_1 CR5-6]